MTFQNDWDLFRTILSDDTVSSYSMGVFDIFTVSFKNFIFENEIFLKVGYKTYYRCDECEEQCLCEAHSKNVSGKKRWFIPCQYEGLKEITKESLLRWRFDPVKFASILAKEIGFLTPPVRKKPDGLFYLGNYCLGTYVINTYFSDNDTLNQLREENIDNSMFLTLSDEKPNLGSNVIIKLDEWFTFTDGKLQANRELLEKIILSRFQFNESKLNLPTVKDFKHSPDFRSVNWRGKVFSFNSNQATIIKALYEAHCNKTPSLGSEYLLGLIEKDGGFLKDIFKNHPAWKSLLIGQAGNYRLDL